MTKDDAASAMKTIMGPEWVEENRQRVLRMERLYVLDGRHRPDHELHGVYSGLWDKAAELEKELDE